MASHLLALGTGLEKQRHDGRYTDFTIVSADEHEFMCHQAVLAAVSPFFDTMFNSGLQEAENKRAKLESFEKEHLELILRYIYTGDESVITTNSVAVLYHAANFLGISTLAGKCEEFLTKETDDTISLEIWQISKMFGKNDIAEIARTRALANFKIFCHIDEVRRISFEHLKDILADPYVNCSGPDKCRFAWVWIVAQASVTEDDARSLIGALVKSPNVKPEQILGSCSEHNCQDIKEELAEIDEEVLYSREQMWAAACEFIWIRPGTSQTSMILYNKAGNDSSEWLVVIGGSHQEPSKITLLNFTEKKWFYVETPANVDLGHGYAVCSIGSFMYLTGGTQRQQQQFRVFDVDRTIWQQRQNLPFGRENHIMTTINNDIFVIGGFSKIEDNSRGIYKYTTRSDKWSKCGEIAYPIVNATSAVVGTKVFILGGAAVENNTPSKSPSDLIQCYESNTGFSYKLEFCLPVKIKAHTASASHVENDIYIFHKGRVFKLNEKTKPTEVCSLPKGAPNKGFASPAFGDKILLFGGEDDNFKESDQVLQYDTKSNECIRLQFKTPFKMSSFVYTKIKVPTIWSLIEAK